MTLAISLPCYDFNAETSIPAAFSFGSAQGGITDPPFTPDYGDLAGFWSLVQDDPFSHLAFQVPMMGDVSYFDPDNDAWTAWTADGLDPSTDYVVTMWWYNISYCLAFCGDALSEHEGCGLIEASCHAFGESAGDGAPSSWIEGCWPVYGVGHYLDYESDIKSGSMLQRSRSDGTMDLKFGFRDINSYSQIIGGLFSFCFIKPEVGGSAFLL